MSVRGKPAAGRAATAWLLLALAAVAALPLSVAPAMAAAARPSRAVRRELDRDEALLRLQLISLPDGSGVDIEREPERVTLRIPAPLLFEPDSADVKSEAVHSVALAATVTLLKRRPSLAARISVYSDSIGGAASNQGFTEARAQHLRALLSSVGIATVRLDGHGGGQSLPMAANDTPEARSLNRRVEIEFAPQGAVRLGPAAAP